MATAPPNKPFPQTVITKLRELGLSENDIQLAIHAKLPENFAWFQYKNLLDAHKKVDAVWHEQILECLSNRAVNKREHQLTLEVLGKQLDIKAVQRHTNFTKSLLERYRSYFLQAKTDIDIEAELAVFESARYDVFQDENLLNELIGISIKKESVADLDTLYTNCPPVCKAENTILKCWRAFMLDKIPAETRPEVAAIKLATLWETEDMQLADVRSILKASLKKDGLDLVPRLLDRYKVFRKIVYTYYQTPLHYLSLY